MEAICHSLSLLLFFRVMLMFRRAIVEDVTENRNERDAVYLNLALEGVFETAYQVSRHHNRKDQHVPII